MRNDRPGNSKAFRQAIHFGYQDFQVWLNIEKEGGCPSYRAPKYFR